VPTWCWGNPPCEAWTANPDGSTTTKTTIAERNTRTRTMNNAKAKNRSKHKVWIVWGEEDTILENGENCIAGYEFATPKEVDAFLLDVSEGAEGQEVVQADTKKEAKQIVADIKQRYSD